MMQSICSLLKISCLILINVQIDKDRILMHVDMKEKKSC